MENVAACWRTHQHFYYHSAPAKWMCNCLINSHACASKVRIGRHTLTGYGEQFEERKGSSFVTHPLHNQRAKNDKDVAIVFLDSPVTTVEPVALASEQGGRTQTSIVCVVACALHVLMAVPHTHTHTYINVYTCMYSYKIS